LRIHVPVANRGQRLHAIDRTISPAEFLPQYAI
jgi:hypothetical protein